MNILRRTIPGYHVYCCTHITRIYVPGVYKIVLFQYVRYNIPGTYNVECLTTTRKYKNTWWKILNMSTAVLGNPEIRGFAPYERTG